MAIGRDEMDEIVGDQLLGKLPAMFSKRSSEAAGGDLHQASGIDQFADD